MLKRVISAFVLIPIVIFFIFFLPKTYFIAVSLLIGLTAFCETVYMVDNKFKNINKLLIILLSIVSTLIFFLIFINNTHLLTSYIISLLFFIFTIFIFHFFSRREMENIFWSTMPSILLYFYIILFFSFAILIRFDLTPRKGGYLVLLWLVINWAGDSFAYFGGKLFGAHKLSPKLSPKKTIEGTVSGILGGIFAGILIQILFLNNLNMWFIILISLLTQISGQMGDLFESLIKRFFGVKDSSNLIPGHGGMFDRIDSLILSAPIFYYFFKFLRF